MKHKEIKNRRNIMTQVRNKVKIEVRRNNKYKRSVIRECEVWK